MKHQRREGDRGLTSRGHSDDDDDDDDDDDEDDNKQTEIMNVRHKN